MIVVGVGCGPGMMTPMAIEEIRKAVLVAGSERALEMASPYLAGKRVLRLDEIKGIELPADAVLLSTGDPMLAGLGLRGARVIPGISSMQLAFARLRLPMVGALAIDCHGRDGTAEAMHELAWGRRLFLIADPDFDVEKFAFNVRQARLRVRLVLFQDLGYPTEAMIEGTELEPPTPTSRLFALVVVPRG